MEDNGLWCAVAVLHLGSTWAAPMQYREGYNLVAHHRLQLLHITHHKTLQRTFKGNEGEGLGHLLLYFRKPFLNKT